ncbi:MAG: SDR family oxidoreductase [Pseudomonadota bacterium]
MAALEGKRAIVTGGGTGVGAAIARALAGAGCEVVICGRQLETLEAMAAEASNVTPVTVDVTCEASVAKLFQDAGPFDIVVANAGAADSAPLTRTSAELFDRMLDINLRGTFLTFREGLKALDGRPWGRLIAVASTAGLKGYSYVSAYCAAKHGVVGLVRAAALEAAGSGITVNALCPGFTDTPLLERSVANIVSKTQSTPEDARATLARTNPMGRLIDPDEVAAAALWLVGPGSDAVAGQAISISGGETW